MINCAGLHADSVARMMGVDIGVRIIPFRGEYFSLRPERANLVKGLIYPVPDPSLPFLGVHFTKRISGSVEAGPNAVLALAREGYKKTGFSLTDMLGHLTYPGFWRMSKTYWKTGFQEHLCSDQEVAGVLYRNEGGRRRPLDQNEGARDSPPKRDALSDDIQG